MESVLDRLSTVAEKYLKIAELFTSRYDAEDLQVRFDVMSLVVTDNAHATIRHYINAFGAESL